MHLICFDLEGPLSPQDNAYHLMGLFKHGYKIFEVLSRYDDLLALEGREGYEAGDTLKLIVPFLLANGIREEDVKKISRKAKLVNGSKELISALRKDWNVYIISTSYHQHAYNVGSRLGLSKRWIRCTRLQLDKYKEEFKEHELIERMERKILGFHPPDDDERIKRCLDDFFWRVIPQTGLGKIMGQIEVCGGKRKVKVLGEICKTENRKLSEVVVVGDSITDVHFLKAVKENNGISVAFNANEYALPHANIGLASPRLSDLRLVTDAYIKGGVDKVFKKVGGAQGSKKPPYWHLLPEANMKEAISMHKKVRRFVRGESAKLG